jgi:hypothetical protein
MSEKDDEGSDCRGKGHWFVASVRMATETVK